MAENVNHPSHYTSGGIECIEAIKASLGNKGFSDYCKGNVIKYVWRYRLKNGIEDLEKAKVYLNWLIEAEKEIVPKPDNPANIKDNEKITLDPITIYNVKNGEIKKVTLENKKDLKDYLRELAEYNFCPFSKCIHLTDEIDCSSCLLDWLNNKIK